MSANLGHWLQPSKPRSGPVALPPMAAEHAVSRLFPSPPQYADKPLAWVQDVCGEFLWSKQREIAESLVHNRYTAVKSCHDAGKSFIASRLIAYWAETYGTEGFVVWTAPTFPQVNAIIGRELKALALKANLSIEMMGNCELRLEGRLIGYGRKPADYDQAAFQGIHAKYVLVVIDEACGVPESLYDAADALLTNENARCLAIGNPDDPSTHFEKICRPGSGWNTIRIDGYETPNFTDEAVPDSLRPLLLSPTWVDERKARWGENSPLFTAKVRGEFPTVSSDNLISPAMLAAAHDRQLSGMTTGAFGLDVARFGDDESVLYRNRGGVIRLEAFWGKTSTMETVGKVVGIIDGARGHVPVHVDVIGVGGGVADRLREQDYLVYDFNGAESASDPTRFKNKRAEAYWLLRELMEEGLIDLDPDDDRLSAELLEIKWKVDSANRVYIEPKDKIRKRLKRSPDRADAAVMALYNSVLSESWDQFGEDEPVRRKKKNNKDILEVQW